MPDDHHDSDVHVYEHDFDDVDLNHAGTADLEFDYAHIGHLYDHVGTYNLASEHDRAVYHDVLDRHSDVFDFTHEHYDDLVVVHRRVR